jgi:hypothetical protein
MQALLINGSPRPSGATATLLEALAEGLRQGGAAIDTVALRTLDLSPCRGCFTCWVGTPGQCVFDDSMRELLPRVAGADLLVFGTPLYYFGMTGQMKLFFDRTLPLVQPWLTVRPDGLTTHPSHAPRRARPMGFLVSPCGFPERDHFAALVATFRLMADRKGWDWRGELLRPGAAPLAMRSLRPELNSYLDLVVDAGRALATAGWLPPALQSALAADLMPGGAAALREAANCHWEALLQQPRPAA